ncbi:MAG TPA: calcium/sodium antiporter [Kofleriaceae bacterium]
MLALDVVMLAIGTLVLFWGSRWLVNGSSAIARAFGVTRYVVGLTVVAYGTSAPELAVATNTALSHSQPIALGTVVGSCAANISLILGLTALIRPPTIDGRVIRREAPVLIGSAIAVPLLFRNGVLSRLEGSLLVVCAIIFTIATLTIGARDGEQQKAEARPRMSRSAAGLMTVLGLVLLLAGTHLFIKGGRGIGAHLGMSERMLGLTVIAIGTALPELVTSLIGAIKGEDELAIGNLIGSNLLNVFLVLGVTACLRPIRLGERMHLVDLVGLVGITLLAVVVLRGSRKITRLEGALLVAAYVAFIVCSSIL